MRVVDWGWFAVRSWQFAVGSWQSVSGNLLMVNVYLNLSTDTMASSFIITLSNYSCLSTPGLELAH